MMTRNRDNRVRLILMLVISLLPAGCGKTDGGATPAGAVVAFFNALKADDPAAASAMLDPACPLLQGDWKDADPRADHVRSAARHIRDTKATIRIHEVEVSGSRAVVLFEIGYDGSAGDVQSLPLRQVFKEGSASGPWRIVHPDGRLAYLAAPGHSPRPVAPPAERPTAPTSTRPVAPPAAEPAAPLPVTPVERTAVEPARPPATHPIEPPPSRPIPPPPVGTAAQPPVRQVGPPAVRPVEPPAPVTTKPLPAAVELPRVGTLHEVPEGEGVIVVGVDADGRITIRDRGPLSLLGLRDELRLLTSDPAWREPDRSSKKVLVIRADASVPWFVGQWILQTAAEPYVGIYRIAFAARPWEGSGMGVVEAFLPKDRGINMEGFVDTDPQEIKVRLFAREGLEAHADPERLFSALQQTWATLGNDPHVKLDIRTPPPYGVGVPTGAVVRVVDVARRVGLEGVTFEGAAPPLAGMAGDADQLLDYVARIKARNAKVKIRLGTTHTFVGTQGQVPMPPANARGLLRRAPTLEGVPATPFGEGAGEPGGVTPEPVIRDSEFSDHIESDSDLPYEEEFGTEGISDAPFTGPANSGLIGLGGGAGGAFAGRGGRRGLAGSTRSAKDALDDALKWLAAHQSPSGGWEAGTFMKWCDGKPAATGPDGAGKAMYDPGVTGLALCAFLGAGYTNRGQHAFAKTVSKGLRYLKNVQDAEGCFGPRSGTHFIYNHATAALAMVEAYGMTGSPIFKGSAQRALDFIALARNPYFGWRYGVKPGDNDTSVTCWMTNVLQSAKLINDDARKSGKPEPLTIDEEAFDGARMWFEKMTDPDYGRVGYNARGGSPARPQELVDRFPGERSESMTAAAAFTRIVMGEDPRQSAVIEKGVDLCANLPPTWNPANGSIDMYYWYWGANALFQIGGTPWAKWDGALRDVLLENQRRDGTYCGVKGSWDPIGPWGPDGGRVYATAMLALCLETPYRYDRVFGTR